MEKKSVLAPPNPELPFYRPTNPLSGCRGGVVPNPDPSLTEQMREAFSRAWHGIPEAPEEDDLSSDNS